MASAPIEVQAGRRGPLGMAPTRFLRDYWQKRPLLIRGAFPDFQAPLSSNDLAGLACEPGARARIILHERSSDRWELETGPFAEARFATLPERDWTLLVQDVDRWDPEVRALLAHFAFLPRWRIDDIMISHAAPGGSVGAHVDHYDVFLLQASGHRRWQIDARPGAALAWREDAPIKLLREFSPSHDWLLEPGDMLYLPPQLPHLGVAEDDCLTFSIGMRAPSVSELLVDWAEDLAGELDEASRYTDPDLLPAREPGLLDDAAVARLRVLLQSALDLDEQRLGRWFARYLSLYRLAELPQAAARPSSLAAIGKRLARGGRLQAAPGLRLCYRRDGKAAWLAVAGDEIRTSHLLARRLASGESLGEQDWQTLQDPDRQALRAMLGRGWVAWCSGREGAMGMPGEGARAMTGEGTSREGTRARGHEGK